MTDTPQGEPESTSVRRFLAYGLTALSAVLVFALAIVMVVTDHTNRPEMAKYVFSAVLPLVGTWVGTILAHYFSKENFEAATNSITAVARQITPEEKLKSLPVKARMIPPGDMLVWVLPTDKDKTLFDIRDQLVQRKKGMRVPILSEAKHPLYVIHQSAIDRYLADRLSSQPVPDKASLTLQKFLDDNKDSLGSTFSTVKEDATLGDAKDAMDRMENCQDVFVTKAGTKDEEVLGWVTNNIIQDNARV